MNKQIYYFKGNEVVGVSSKYVYCSSIYKIWRKGAILLREKRFACFSPINFKTTLIPIYKKDYIIQRFITLESAPEEYLITKGYKQKEI